MAQLVGHTTCVCVISNTRSTNGGKTERKREKKESNLPVVFDNFKFELTNSAIAYAYCLKIVLVVLFFGY